MKTSRTSRAAIIVAGGSGVRMGADIPKQFLDLAGKPVLLHTLMAFHRCDSDIRLIVVLPEEHISFWNKLYSDAGVEVPHSVTAGGAERFHSVKSGLALLRDETLVAVHDGVRPLVSTETIEAVFLAAKTDGAAVPTVPVVDTLRRVANNSSHWVNRAEYVRVQTPQAFQADLFKTAYDQPFTPDFTDDASVVEKLGHAVALVRGNDENIKITSKADLQIAAALLPRN